MFSGHDMHFFTMVHFLVYKFLKTVRFQRTYILLFNQSEETFAR